MCLQCFLIGVTLIFGYIGRTLTILIVNSEVLVQQLEDIVLWELCY